MADIAENLTGSDRKIVIDALARVNTDVERLLQVLRVIHRYTELRHSVRAHIPPLQDRIWRPLQRAFDLKQVDSLAPRRIGMVIRRYEGARRIIQSPSCLISRYLGEGSDEVWGRAMMDTRPAQGYRYEIQVGGSFLALPAESNWHRAVHDCVSGFDDVGLLRVSTLVHEAIHWYNREGGHSELGMFRDPYNYDWYLIEASCQPPPQMVDKYRTRQAHEMLGQVKAAPQHGVVAAGHAGLTPGAGLISGRRWGPIGLA